MSLIHFIDIETTHLNPLRGDIIEICILTSIDGGITLSDDFCIKIKPQNLQTADPNALKINGYSDEKWTNAYTWQQAESMIALKLKYGTIVAHNAMFEHRWLNHHLSTGISWRWQCTKMLAIEHLPHLRSHSMKTLRRVFGISAHNAHTAKKDAYDCWYLYKKLNRASIFDRLWVRMLAKLRL